MTFEQWIAEYYEVIMGYGPIVYCDDWTMPLDETMWKSYVVIPQETRP